MYQQHFSVFCDTVPSPEIIKYQIWKESCTVRRKDFEGMTDGLLKTLSQNLSG